MSNSIGNAAIVLGVDSAGMSSGLKQAASTAKAEVGAIASTATKTLGKAGPWGAIGAAAATGIGAAVGFVSSALNDAYKSFGKLQSIGKGAAALGIDVEAYQGLAGVLGKVGVEGDQVGAVLGKLGAKIGQAANGNAELAGVFASLGLDAAKLVSMPLDKQFAAIADGIAKLPPGGKQAAAALKLFEEAGIKLLPALQKGGKGVQEFIDRQKSLGGIFSKQEVEMASKAKAAWGQAVAGLDALWENFKQRALIALAPIIESGGKILGKVVDQLTPLVPVVQQVFEAIAEVSVPLFELVSDVVGGLVVDTAAWLKSTIDIGGTFGTVRELVLPILNGLGVGFATLWDAVKVGAGAISLTFGVAIEGLGDLLIAFQDTLRSVVTTAKEYWYLFGAAGLALRNVDPNKMGEYGASIKQMGKDWQAWGTAQADAFGRSAQAVDEWFAALERRKKNEPDFAGGDLDFGAGGEWEDLSKKAKTQGYVATAAMREGSQEALSTINRFQFSMAGKDDVPKKQLEEAKAQKKILQDIFNAMNKGGSEVW